MLNIQVSSSNIGVEELIIAGIGYIIVFAALVVLYYAFNLIPKVLNSQIRNRLKREGKEISEAEINISGEVNAAISAALYLFFSELHDEESNILTIKRLSKTYSPWSSKIYGLRTFRKL
jgi:Na+-transporting methylmalonyl-CoA/oxaloacetate decarboxylase gamma subunit